MDCKAEVKPVSEIKSTNILPQSRYWADLKSRSGYRPNCFELRVSSRWLDPKRKDKIVCDDLLVLIRKVNKDRCFAYVPYGPKIEPLFEYQGVFLEELSETLRSQLPGNCVFIRYDLLWENQWSGEEEYYDTYGNWIGPPSQKAQEVRVNFNTRHWKLQKSPTDHLPKNTFFLDLTKSEYELLMDMKYNTRHSIRKAMKNGIKIKECRVDHLEDWYQLYAETAERNNMPADNREYFYDLLENERTNSVKVKLLMAKHLSDYVAGMFLLLSKDRATYLFGASTLTKRHLKASYALQWDAIKRAIAYGCREYDMFGCAPNKDQTHPLSGVHRFKKGFGGEIFHRMGCWDYPYKEEDYQLMRQAVTI